MASSRHQLDRKPVGPGKVAYSLLEFKRQRVTIPRKYESNVLTDTFERPSAVPLVEPKPVDHPNSGPTAMSWERFGIRHILLWMFCIAVVNLLFRLLQSTEFAAQGTGWSGGEGLGTINLWTTLPAIASGTLLGLGFPIILRGPKHSTFLEHPARVLFTLFAALAILELFVRLLSSGLLGSYRGDLSLSAGVVATAFVWALYALVRPRIGVVWRFAILLCCVSLANDFVYICSLISLIKSAGGTGWIPYGTLDSNVYLIVSVISSIAVGATLVFAGVLELLFGRFKDWRTWMATFILPLCLLLNHAPSIGELLRAYQLRTQAEDRTASWLKPKICLIANQESTKQPCQI